MTDQEEEIIDCAKNMRISLEDIKNIDIPVFIIKEQLNSFRFEVLQIAFLLSVYKNETFLMKHFTENVNIFKPQFVPLFPNETSPYFRYITCAFKLMFRKNHLEELKKAFLTFLECKLSLSTCFELLKDDDDCYAFCSSLYFKKEGHLTYNTGYLECSITPEKSFKICKYFTDNPVLMVMFMSKFKVIPDDEIVNVILSNDNEKTKLYTCFMHNKPNGCCKYVKEVFEKLHSWRDRFINSCINNSGVFLVPKTDENGEIIINDFVIQILSHKSCKIRYNFGLIIGQYFKDFEIIYEKSGNVWNLVHIPTKKTIMRAGERDVLSTSFDPIDLLDFLTTKK